MPELSEPPRIHRGVLVTIQDGVGSDQGRFEVIESLYWPIDGKQCASLRATEHFRRGQVLIVPEDELVVDG